MGNGARVRNAQYERHHIGINYHYQYHFKYYINGELQFSQLNPENKFSRFLHAAKHIQGNLRECMESEIPGKTRKKLALPLNERFLSGKISTLQKDIILHVKLRSKYTRSFIFLYSALYKFRLWIL